MDIQVMTEAEFLEAVRAKSTRQVVAEFMVALGQLALHFALPDLTALSINFHGRLQRLDIATLSEDGQHLDEWLMAVNVDVADPAFGDHLSLPTPPGPAN